MTLLLKNTPSECSLWDAFNQSALKMPSKTQKTIMSKSSLLTFFLRRGIELRKPCNSELNKPSKYFGIYVDAETKRWLYVVEGILSKVAFWASDRYNESKLKSYDIWQLVAINFSIPIRAS
jgi:hypothetical protein